MGKLLRCMVMQSLAIAFLLALAAATVPAPTPALGADAPLAAPIAKTPGSRPRGTVMLLPASGWASPTRTQQGAVWSRLAPTLFGAGYRVVAIDYARGATEGLASVRRAVLAESKRPRTGPLCLYGESSGGHLALLAGNRMPQVDCVITFGTPVSFTALVDQVAAHPDNLGYASALQTVRDTFGGDWAGWEPADLRTPMRVPALTMICADDLLIPLAQAEMLPGAESFIAPSGDLDDPSDAYVHGSISRSGKLAAERRIVGFVERSRRSVLSARRS